MNEIITCFQSEANHRLREGVSDLALFFLLSLLLTVIIKQLIFSLLSTILAAALAVSLILLVIRRLRIRRFVQHALLKEPKQYRLAGNTAFLENRWLSWYRGRGINARYQEIAEGYLTHQLQPLHFHGRQSQDRNWKLQLHCRDGRYTVISLAGEQAGIQILQFIQTQNPSIILHTEFPSATVTLEELKDN